MASEEAGSATRRRGRYLKVILIAINGLLLLPIGYCAVVSTFREPPVAPGFQRALEGVMRLNAENAATGLVALTPGNGLFWDQTGPQSPRVLVAVWTDYGGYRKHLEQGCKVSKPSGIWVTPVPQAQEACRGFGLSGADLDRRLEKYLGLAAGGTYSEVVELWVNPDDIFRPCPDDEIDDTECNPGLPKISEGASEDQLRHARWFQQQFQSYYGENRLPWTRYGYTYDWGDPDRKVGASEYVIRDGAKVFVSSVTRTAAYCSPQTTLPRAPAPAGVAFDDPC